MDAEVTETEIDELTYEPVSEPEIDQAVGLILDSLRRRQPTMTIS